MIKLNLKKRLIHFIFTYTYFKFEYSSRLTKHFALTWNKVRVVFYKLIYKLLHQSKFFFETNTWTFMQKIEDWVLKYVYMYVDCEYRLFTQCKHGGCLSLVIRFWVHFLKTLYTALLEKSTEGIICYNSAPEIEQLIYLVPISKRRGRRFFKKVQIPLRVYRRRVYYCSVGMPRCRHELQL